MGLHQTSSQRQMGALNLSQIKDRSYWSPKNLLSHYRLHPWLVLPPTIWLNPTGTPGSSGKVNCKWQRALNPSLLVIRHHSLPLRWSIHTLKLYPVDEGSEVGLLRSKDHSLPLSCHDPLKGQSLFSEKDVKKFFSWIGFCWSKSFWLIQNFPTREVLFKTQWKKLNN